MAKNNNVILLVLLVLALVLLRQPTAGNGEPAFAWPWAITPTVPLVTPPENGEDEIAPEAPTEPYFPSVSSCNAECIVAGYDGGLCEWPALAGEGLIDTGFPCWVAGSRHCGTFDMCNCYCWFEEGASPSEPPPEGGEESVGWPACDAFRIAEEKPFYTLIEPIPENLVDACYDHAWSHCDLIGKWVTTYDILEPDCCVWRCSE